MKYIFLPSTNLFPLSFFYIPFSFCLIFICLSVYFRIWLNESVESLINLKKFKRFYLNSCGWLGLHLTRTIVTNLKWMAFLINFLFPDLLCIPANFVRNSVQSRDWKKSRSTFNMKWIFRNSQPGQKCKWKKCTVPEQHIRAQVPRLKNSFKAASKCVLTSTYICRNKYAYLLTKFSPIHYDF